MVRIDNTDRKLLYELILNSRQPYSIIGKKNNVSKNLINYRVNRLKKAHIIKEFITSIDIAKIGYITPRLHIKFKNTTKEIEQSLIDFLIKNSYCMLVSSTIGFFDLSIIFCIKDMKVYYKLWDKIKIQFGKYIQSHYLSFFQYDLHYTPQYLLRNMDDRRFQIDKYQENSQMNCDIIDLKILKLISDNSRRSNITIANTLDISSSTVINRLKNLYANSIIRNYTINININYFGYKDYKLYIFLNDYSVKNSIIQYVKRFPNFICVDFTTGESDLELEFHVKTIEEFENICYKIKEHFKSKILRLDFILVKQMHKLLYFPDISL